MAAKNDYYVYVYSHPDTRQPFYVGKGRGGRALNAQFGFGRFTYEKIRRPRGRF